MDHYRLTYLLRVVLPVLAGAALVMMFFSAREIPANANDAYLEKRLSNIDNQREVVKPQYQGLNGKNERIEVRAQSTFLQRRNDQEIEAVAPDIFIDHHDKTITTGGADRGMFEQNFDLMVLRGTAWLEKTDGYSLRSNEIFYDLAQNTVFTKSAFEGTFPQGEISANQMQMVLPEGTTGFTANFQGDVKMVFEPQTKDARK